MSVSNILRCHFWWMWQDRRFFVRNKDQEICYEFQFFPTLTENRCFLPLSWEDATRYPQLSTVKGYFKVVFFIEHVKVVHTFKIIQNIEYNLVLEADFTSICDVDYNEDMKTLTVFGSYGNLSYDLNYASLIYRTKDVFAWPHITTVVTAWLRGMSYFQTVNTESD